MKKKNLINLILVFINIFLIGYIIILKNDNKNINYDYSQKEEISLVKTISLEYAEVYLTSDGLSYIRPLNKEEIKKINGGKNLKERLKTLYDRAFYYQIG